MLNLTIKLITFCVTPIFSFLVVKELLDSKESIFKIKEIFLLSLLVLVNFFTYQTQYQTQSTLIVFLLSILVYKFIFKLKTSESVLVVITLFIMLTASDIIASLVFLRFVSIEDVRNIPQLMLLSNIIVGISSILIAKIKILKRIVNNFVFIRKSKKFFKLIMFFTLTILLIFILLYVMATNYDLISKYFFSIIVMIILVVLFFIYINENNDRVDFENKYKMLFEYSKTFENVIDNEKMMIHEYKNQLAAISGLKSISEVRKYIDNTIMKNMELDKYYINELKNIPNGGLKGVVFYKIILAKERNLNIFVNISKNIKGKIEILSPKIIEDLIKIIGISFDNAIEASQFSKKKNVSLEIYQLKKNINIIISNSFENKDIDISRINEKNYSTKGKGRGRGLYYMSKIIQDQRFIEVNKNIVEDYFNTEIIVKSTSI